MILNSKPNVLGLVETRCSGSHADANFSKVSFDNWTRIEALGFRGGIWLFWKDHLNISIIRTHPQFIHVRINQNGHQPWLLTVVYASTTPSLRKLLWKELHHNRIPLSDPWLVVGDFNSLRHISETNRRIQQLDFRTWPHRPWLLRTALYVDTRHLPCNF